ncbi:MAG: hypothetical protein ACOC5F_00995 [Candidatus Aminicenantaceae bacterium]
MSIKRCPYCKSVVDEDSEYCLKCGTRLVFSEETEINEDTSNEKIPDTDDEYESSDEERDEEQGDKDEEQGDKEEEQEKESTTGIINKEYDSEEESKEEEHTGEFKKEEELEDESLSQEEKQAEDKEKDSGESLPEEMPEVDKIGQSILDFLKEKEGKKISSSEELETESKKPGQGTTEFEEEKKAEIDRFINSIKKERGIKDSETQKDSDTQEESVKQNDKERTPTWAEEIKKTGKEEDLEKAERKKEYFELREIVHDDTVFRDEDSEEKSGNIEIETEEEFEKQGEQKDEETQKKELKEKQKRLIDLGRDFGTGEKHQKEAPWKQEEEHPIEKFDLTSAKEEQRKRSSSPTFDMLKSRFFDLIFVAVFWFASIFIASLMMNVSIFGLVTVSAVQVVIFYLVLTGIYFFLFVCFLGETPGDRFFRREE